MRRACLSVARRCESCIRLWPLRLDNSSRALIDAGGTRRPDWPAHVLANDVSIGAIDSTRAELVAFGTQLQQDNATHIEESSVLV